MEHIVVHQSRGALQSAEPRDPCRHTGATPDRVGQSHHDLFSESSRDPETVRVFITTSSTLKTINAFRSYYFLAMIFIAFRSPGTTDPKSQPRRTNSGHFHNSDLDEILIDRGEQQTAPGALLSCTSAGPLVESVRPGDCLLPAPAENLRSAGSERHERKAWFPLSLSPGSESAHSVQRCGWSSESLNL
jgi:hypothetical protein